MIMNMDSESNAERFKPVKGIGLYKVSYEMDVKGSSDRPQYTAGVIAYTSEEAIQTLIDFSTKNVKGFKGMKVNEMAFEGLCHAISDRVKNVILSGAVREGQVIATEAHRAVLVELEESMKKEAKTKKSIVKKSKE